MTAAKPRQMSLVVEPKCYLHTTEIARNCRSCAADRKAAS